VIRRALLEAIGGWNEAGFLYHEDVELSWLLRLMGHELYCVPAAVARHDYHLTMDPAKFFLLERNRLALLRTHLGPAARRRLGPMRLCTETLTLLYCLLRGPAFVRAKISAYRWLRRNGPAIARRRGAVEALRTVDDRAVLRRLTWAYDARQFLVLGIERNTRRRRGRR
jgi:GT2 family glycosyltransferase